MGICKSVNKKPKKSNTTNQYNINNTFNYNQENTISNRNYALSNRETNNFSKNFSNLKTKTTHYEKGEKYFIRKTDLNIHNNNNNNDNYDDPKMNIDLFLSLEDVQNSTNLYSIKLSICNNKLINQFKYLEETKE